MNTEKRQEGPRVGALTIEPMLSMEDLAQVLNCSRRGLERLRAAGRVPKPDFQFGRCPRWRPETIRAWIEKGSIA